MLKSANMQNTDRGARRRLQTRGRLIDAARELVAHKAIEATPINEITEAADVAIGSFYNHFESKEQLLEAVAADTMEKHGAAVERAIAGMDDPAEVLAASVRLTIQKADNDPIWARFIVRTNALLHAMREGLGHRLAGDLRRGFRAGRFAAYDERTITSAIGGAVVGVMAGRLLGEVPADADVHLAKEVLCMLGLRPDEANSIANRPLPGTNGARKS